MQWWCHWHALKESALARWYFVTTHGVEVLGCFHQIIASTKDEQHTHKHHSDTASKQQQYDKSVSKLVEMFEANFIDPFDVRKTPFN